MLRRSLVLLLLAVPLAACGDDGPDYAAFCEAYEAGGGDVQRRTGDQVEQLEFFGSEEHVDQLQRIRAAMPDDEERGTEAIDRFLTWIRDEYEPKPGPPNPAAWPGDVRVAYDRLTWLARDECDADV